MNIESQIFIRSSEADRKIAYSTTGLRRNLMMRRFYGVRRPVTITGINDFNLSKREILR